MLLILILVILLALMFGTAAWATAAENKAEAKRDHARTVRRQAIDAKYNLITDHPINWVPLHDKPKRVIAFVDGKPRPCELQFVGKEPYVFTLDSRSEADRNEPVTTPA